MRIPAVDMSFRQIFDGGKSGVVKSREDRDIASVQPYSIKLIQLQIVAYQSYGNGHQQA